MKKDEQIYTVPLRKAYDYKKNRRSMKAIKLLRQFVEKHSKLEQVLLSMKVNEFIWARSMEKPPRRIKVRVVKKDGVANVYLPDEKPEQKKVEVKKETKEDKKEVKDSKTKETESTKEEKKEHVTKAPNAKEEMKKIKPSPVVEDVKKDVKEKTKKESTEKTEEKKVTESKPKEAKKEEKK